MAKDNDSTSLEKSFDTNLLVVILIGIFLPYVARLVGTIKHGVHWFLDYVPSIGAVLFFSVFDAIVPASLFMLRIFNPNRNIPFLCAASLGYIGMFLFHATFDLGSSSTAAVAFLFVPAILGVPLVLLGWGVGILVERSKNRHAH